MTTKETLKNAVKDAMRAKDTVRLNAIRGVLAEIQYEEMAKAVAELSVDGIQQVIGRTAKKLKEEIDFNQQAGRTDDLIKLNAELTTIESFLPKQMSKEELTAIVSAVIASSSDSEKNMGAVMKILKDNHHGTYDAKMASEVVKGVLAG